MLASPGSAPPAAAPDRPPPPQILFDVAVPHRLERAMADLRGGFARWRLAAALARLEIRNRYRGSVLGPFWLTLSTGAMVFGLGLLFGTLMQVNQQGYFAHLAVSLIVWNTIAAVVTESCTTLTAAEGVIRQLPLPYTTYVLRMVLRNAVVAAHNLPLIVVVFLATGHHPGWEALLALPGLALLGINAVAAGLLLGMLCARFRDIPPIVGSVMQLTFFLTPIIWQPAQLGRWQWLLPFNPFYVLLETVRGPLVEGGGALLVWGAALAYTALHVGLALAFFVRFRGRAAFWV